jgi:hypothetical protein
MNQSKLADLISIRNFLEGKASSNHSLGLATEQKMRLSIKKMDDIIIRESIAFLNEEVTISNADAVIAKLDKALAGIPLADAKTIKKREAEEKVARQKEEAEMAAKKADPKTQEAIKALKAQFEKIDEPKKVLKKKTAKATEETPAS